MSLVRFAPLLSIGLAFLGNSSLGFNSQPLPEITAFSPVPSIGIYTTGPAASLTYLTRNYYYLSDNTAYTSTTYFPYPVCKNSVKHSHPSFFTQGRFTLYSDGRCLHVLQFFSSPS